MIRIKNLYENIVKTTTQILIEVGSIKELDYEIYYFGLYEGGIFVFNVLLTLMIAGFIQNIWIGIVFLVAFFPVRRFAGGYHAKTREGCLFFSILIIVFAMNGIKVMTELIFSYKVLLLFCCALLILCLSPVPTERKNLTNIEMKVYRNRLLIILSIEVLAGILMGNYGLEVFTTIVLMALLVGLGLICLGRYMIYKQEN